jgi:hypothetical protein
MNAITEGGKSEEIKLEIFVHDSRSYSLEFQRVLGSKIPLNLGLLDGEEINPMSKLTVGQAWGTWPLTCARPWEHPSCKASSFTLIY